MGDTDRDRSSDTPQGPAATPAHDDPERTVVVPGRPTAPPAPTPDPDSTGDYRVGEETTMVVPPRAPTPDTDRTQLANRPPAAPSSPAARWASSPMTPPPPAATPGPVPRACPTTGRSRR
ncbi:hypothetical protein ACQ86B_28940 (plasmid) [Mycolicibacterium aichiense]|uniref:hypothetical protein n=1 Tax=Mycolicibacterium aichiense TaxID=1799 RepID=UPI003D66C0F1